MAQTTELSALRDELTGAAIGLARACETNPKTEDTDELLRRALLAGADGTDEAALRSLIARVHVEKDRVSPGCAACTARCGSTDDYSPALFAAGPALAAKQQLLAAAQSLARAAERAARCAVPTEQLAAALQTALTFLPLDCGEERLLLAAAQACTAADAADYVS